MYEYPTNPWRSRGCGSGRRIGEPNPPRPVRGLGWVFGRFPASAVGAASSTTTPPPALDPATSRYGSAAAWEWPGRSCGRSSLTRAARADGRIRPKRPFMNNYARHEHHDFFERRGAGAGRPAVAGRPGPADRHAAGRQPPRLRRPGRQLRPPRPRQANQGTRPGPPRPLSRTDWKRRSCG